MTGETAIFEYAEALERLKEAGKLGQAQANFCPLSADRATRARWEGGDFDSWLNALPPDRRKDWELYALNWANNLEYQAVTGKKWPLPTCDGKTQDMPGTKMSRWHPTKPKTTVFVREWPDGPDWVRCGPEWKTEEGWWHAK